MPNLDGHFRFVIETDGTKVYDLSCITAWGDYHGSLVNRSNCLSLVNDCPGVFDTECISTYPLADALTIPAGNVTEDIASLLIALKDEYALHDEEVYSHLQDDIMQEDWYAFACHDFVSLLIDAFDDDIELEEDYLDRLYDAVSRGDVDYYCESATSGTFHGLEVMASNLVNEMR